MAIEQRISALQKRHEWLDNVLIQEMNHAYPDESRVAQIKKSKLRVKDELSQLSIMEQRYMHSQSAEMQRRKVATRH